MTLGLMAFAISTLVMPLAPAAAPTIKTVSVSGSVPGPTAVVVKLGEASLEEYVGGNPDNRIQLGCGGSLAAARTATPAPGKGRE